MPSSTHDRCILVFNYDPMSDLQSPTAPIQIQSQQYHHNTARFEYFKMIVQEHLEHFQIIINWRIIKINKQ